MDKKDEKKDETKAEVITEESLQKTLESLENKENKEEKKPDPVVKTPTVEKTLTDKVKNEAPENLKKAMDVSKALKEYVEITALHVDSALELLQKSIQAGAERDNSVIKILEKNAERMQKMEEKLENYGDKPASTPKSQVSTEKTEVIKKDGDDKKDEKKQFGKRETLACITKMAMDAKQDTPEQKRWAQAVSRYETSGTIKDEDLLEIHGKLVAA